MDQCRRSPALVDYDILEPGQNRMFRPGFSFDGPSICLHTLIRILLRFGFLTPFGVLPMPEKSADHIWNLLKRWTEEDRFPAAGAVFGSSKEVYGPRLFGRQTLAANAPQIRDDAIFLIASPTKPVTALAVMLLMERGELKLTDPIARYLPEFAAHGKRPITVSHCLTHSSGLPDMLPDNAELRARHAPLDEFMQKLTELTPDFPAGTSFQYQSMGSLALSEVLHQVTGKRLADFLHEEIFQPLAMHDTALGMPADWEDRRGGVTREDRIAEVRLPGDAHSAVWNTAYWRRLGAPWGGLLATPADWARLCQHLLKIHGGGDGVLRRATLEAMITNQFERMPSMPEAIRRCQPWGLGWRLNWPHDVQSFGDLLSPAAYGHWGATGTMVWLDPLRDQFAVLLTTQPLDFKDCRHANFSNAVCAAFP